MSDKSLILIACSGRKQQGGVSGLCWNKANSVLSKLPSNYHSQLLDSRLILSRRYNLTSGIDLGGDQTSQLPLLPASMRYDGNLYRRIERNLWTQLEQSSSVALLIVSALYGLLTPWEPIREYNLTMGTAVAHRLTLLRWWVNKGLDSILRSYVTENVFTDVHCFLSGSYAAIGEPLVFLRPTIKIHYKKYPGLGSGSDYYRGRDVNNLLGRLL